MKNFAALCGGACALVLVCGSARGVIVANGGDTIVIAPPPSCALDVSEDNTFARAWNEGTFTLTAPLALNATLPGNYTSVGSLTPGVIPAGTTIQSHYVYSDPIGSPVQMYQGFLDFDQPILGVIILRPQLNASDVVGAFGTTYADNVARGMEVSANENVFITISQLRVGFMFNTTTATDDIRIITAVPAPGALGFFGAAGLLAARRRR